MNKNTLIKQLPDIVTIYIFSNLDIRDLEKLENDNKCTYKIHPRLSLLVNYSCKNNKIRDPFTHINYDETTCINYDVTLLVDEKYVICHFTIILCQYDENNIFTIASDIYDNVFAIDSRIPYNESDLKKLLTFKKRDILRILTKNSRQEPYIYSTNYTIPNWIKDEIKKCHKLLMSELKSDEDLKILQEKINNPYFVDTNMDLEEKNTSLLLMSEVLKFLYEKNLGLKLSLNTELETYRYLKQIILPNIGFKIEDKELNYVVRECSKRLKLEDKNNV